MTMVRHAPVLLDEVLAALTPRPGERAVDGTVGLGGHALALAERLAPGGALLALDRDPAMAAEAAARLSAEAPPDVALHVRPGNARDLAAHLDAVGWPTFDLLLFDAGVCSVHFDEAERGFSMKRDGPLDMRLDPAAGGPTAADLVAGESAATLARLFHAYGEEPNAGRIARALVERRRAAPPTTTGELADLVRACYPPAFRHGRRDPATRVFQALRIAVNDELRALAAMLRTALDRLSIGGRGALISFHSHEDRLVKHTLRTAAGPFFLTREDEHFGRRTFALDVAKPLRPGAAEEAENPRARSATLRTFAKLRAIPAGVSWPEPPHVALESFDADAGRGEEGRR